MYYLELFSSHYFHLADEYEDKERRKRKWFSVEEAHKLLRAFKPIQASYLVAMKQIHENSCSSENSKKLTETTN